MSRKMKERPLGTKAKVVRNRFGYHDFKIGEIVSYLGISETWSDGKGKDDINYYEFINEHGEIDELELGDFSWIENELV